MRSARITIACAAVLTSLATITPSRSAAYTPAHPASARTAARSTGPRPKPVRAPLPKAPNRTQAWVARIVIPTPARTAPEGGRLRTVLPTSSAGNGGPVVLLVLGARRTNRGTTWLRVLLPQRPNGTSGWIDSNLVELTTTPWRIDVSLQARTVTLLRGGRALDAWSAVIGKPSTPTPPGLYSIYERVPQPSPNDFLGTWALLLTAFSPVLQSFDGGPGQVAIHGRGGASLLDPLASARSHGCIRIDNSAVDTLAAHAPEGTPVEIR